MGKLNENIIHLYNKWKEGYTRKENSFKLRVQEFLSNRVGANKFRISEDGKHIDATCAVYIFDEDIQDGKFIVPFGEVGSYFKCSGCTSLKSLGGAPKKVYSFNCGKCTSLTSLEGAPEEVISNFNCSECTSLTSLKGAPKIVKWCFNCSGCASLTSLEGLPKLIENNLYIDERFKGQIPKDVIIKGRIKWK